MINNKKNSTKIKLKPVGIMRYAGSWKNLDGDKVMKYVYEGRKDKNESKRFLKLD